jgi:hypothetical protein
MGKQYIGFGFLPADQIQHDLRFDITRAAWVWAWVYA